MSLEDPNHLSEDVILYILEVITKREAVDQSTESTDVESDWNVFVEHYLPYASNTSMWDEAFAYEENGDVLHKKKHMTPASPKRHQLISLPVWVRTLASAAAILAVVMTGTMTAKAFGFDIWACIISWTQEIFNSRSVKAEITIAKTADLQNLLGKNGIPKYAAPTYLPEGFEPMECGVDKSPVKIEVYGVYCFEESSIYISIASYADNNRMLCF